jgi:hypothetical protein
MKKGAPLCAAALLLSGAPAAAGEASQACRDLATLVEARDFLGGQKLAERQPGHDSHILRARAILTALSADYSFLAQFRGEYTDDGGSCPPQDQQRLDQDLSEPARRARDLLQSEHDLPPWDHAAADLILTWAEVGPGAGAAVVDELERAGDDLLRRYPETPYRRFLFSTIVHRYEPPSAGVELTGFAGLMAFPGKTGQQLDAHPGGGGGVGYLEGNFRIGLELLGSTATLRQALPDRPAWTPDHKVSWFVIEANAGYRPTWGRHGALVRLGLGYARLSLDRGGSSGWDTISYGHGSVAAGYDFAFRSDQRPRNLLRATEWHQLGILLRAELVAFATAGGSGGLAPAGLLFRVGLVAEDRFRERFVE